jgi:hypothetical protein
MKKLLALLGVAVFASTASAATLEMTFSQSAGGPEIGDVITVGPSEIFWVDLWLILAPSETLGTYFYGFNTDIPTGGDFTWETFIPGPDIIETQQPDFVGGIENWTGSGYYNFYAGAPPHGVPVLLGSFDFHCTGQESITLIHVDPDPLHAFFQGDLVTPLVVDKTDAIAGVTVIQVPEPASLALLALGCVALVRRR